MGNVIGIDTSTHQDNPLTPYRIDWTKPKLYGVKFVINRAAFGMALDDDFYYNFEQQKINGYVRSAYAFMDYWSGKPIKDQALNFVNILKNDSGDMPVVFVDFEQATANYPPVPARLTSLSMLETYIKTVEDGLGMACGLYTSPRHIKYDLALFSGATCVIPIPDWLRNRPLWVAAWPSVPAGETAEHYIERTGWSPNIYGQWDHYTFWQYATAPEGLAMGMESKDVDKNYFYGDQEDFNLFINEQPGEQTNMWENNVMIASFDKAGSYTAPATVDFGALKAAGFEAVLLRSGTSDYTQNYDDPTADFVNNPLFPAWIKAATAAGLRVLIDYDFNPMIDVVQGHVGTSTKKHITYLLSGGNKPAEGGALLLNCERNTWTESGAPKTQPANMYSKDLQAVFDWIWNAEHLVAGIRTGQWFLDKKDEGGVTYRSQLGWMDKGQATLPLFMVRLKTDKIPVGTMLNSNIHSLISDIPDPATTMITVNGVTTSEQSYYLYYGNQTKWSGWELAWIKHSAVKDTYGNPAIFRAIMWNGDKNNFDSYFNFPTGGDEPPPPDPDPDPDPGSNITESLARIEASLARIEKKLSEPSSGTWTSSITTLI